jgi:hypothetical protein
LPRELDTKMAETANTLHRHQVAAAQAGAAQGVIGRNPRAQERRRYRGAEVIRNRGHAARFRDHHFRISAVRRHSRDHGVFTIHGVPTSAPFAHSVFAGNEPDAYALADFPPRHFTAQRVYAANDFMSGNAR